MPPSAKLRTEHELFANVDEMLSPAALADALHRPVRTVQRVQADVGGGQSGSRQEWVTLNDDAQQRYLLKHIAPQNDWAMQASQDVLCRSVTLWQYGLLDRLLPKLDHTLVACSREGEGWAMLMRDVSAGLFSLARPWTVAQVRCLLDGLAYLHATFWESEELRSADLGLDDPAGCVGLFTFPSAQHFAQPPGWLRDVILEGWTCMQTLLEPDALELGRELVFKPAPLLAALGKYPVTLVHGDYRGGEDGGNVSVMTGSPAQVCAFDWQLASYGLMTVDLAWFIQTERITLVAEQATGYYRQRLEHYLGFGFDVRTWQAMVDLGFLVDTLRFGCFAAYFVFHETDQANQARLRAQVHGYNDQIRAGARWL